MDSLDPSLFTNTLDLYKDDEGFLWPRRFSPGQLESVGTTPLFSSMALAPAGCCLTFTATGTFFSFQCKRHLAKQKKYSTPLAQNEALKAYGRPFDMTDCFDVSIDGRFLDPIPIKKGLVSIALNHRGNSQVLVKLYFPLCHPVGIKELFSDGSLNSVKANERRLLCLGDSIMQGFMAQRPAFSLASLLGERLSMQTINQGICAYQYDKALLEGLEEIGPFSSILVGLGTNDWNFDQEMQSIKNRVASFYLKLTELFPSIPIFVLTPIWRSDCEQLQPCGTFEELSETIANEARCFENVHVIDGLSVSPHDSTYYTDGFLHPNVQGFQYLADRLFAIMNRTRVTL
jgi:hypothetical protein